MCDKTIFCVLTIWKLLIKSYTQNARKKLEEKQKQIREIKMEIKREVVNSPLTFSTSIRLFHNICWNCTALCISHRIHYVCAWVSLCVCVKTHIDTRWQAQRCFFTASAIIIIGLHCFFSFCSTSKYKYIASLLLLYEAAFHSKIQKRKSDKEKRDCTRVSRATHKCVRA